VEFEELPSTNRWALNAAHSCSHGDVVRALRQTAGYGRYERPWVAHEGASLTFSVVLAGEWLDGNCATGMIPMTAAVAVASTLAILDVKAGLKWPNDVLVSGRKICGILAERRGDKGPVILGVGLNVNTDRESLDRIEGQAATSLLEETGVAHETGPVLGLLIGKLQKWLDSLKAQGPGIVLEAWRSMDALTGSEIVLAGATETTAGRYASLADDGRIRILKPDGSVRICSAGDIVSVRRTRSPGARAG
jgi:BirA family biotin operon repressor/biotin-[acetyl-CoA-carboxylase] ligase